VCTPSPRYRTRPRYTNPSSPEGDRFPRSPIGDTVPPKTCADSMRRAAFRRRKRLISYREAGSYAEELRDLLADLERE